LAAAGLKAQRLQEKPRFAGDWSLYDSPGTAMRHLIGSNMGGLRKAGFEGVRNTIPNFEEGLLNA
jgi:hypothetical protein